MRNFFDFNDLKTKLNSRRHIIIIMLVIIMAGFIIFSDYGIVKRVRLELQKKELANRINFESKRRDSLKIYLNKLTHDTNEIERIAREQYGMIKPGEQVFIIKRKK